MNVAELLLLLAAGPAPGVETDSLLGGSRGLLLLALGLVIVLILLMRLKARGAARADRPPPSAGPSSSRLARDAADRLAVDLEETARAVSALLDTKIRVLDKLVRDADERIARLESSLGAPPAGGGWPGGSAPARAPLEEPLAHHAQIYGLADQGWSVQEIADKTGYQRGEVELVLSLRKIGRSGGQG
jgi:hypothetical protein